MNDFLFSAPNLSESDIKEIDINSDNIKPKEIDINTNIQPKEVDIDSSIIQPKEKIELPSFFTSPVFDNDNRTVDSGEINQKEVKDGNSFFSFVGLDGNAIEVEEEKDDYSFEELKSIFSSSKCFSNIVSSEISEEQKKKVLEINSREVFKSSVNNIIVKNPKERVIILFSAPSRNIRCDVDIPLNISANDLVVGLNAAYNLGLDVSDASQCYLSCENPISLLKGKHLLCEYGIRDGSVITFNR